MEPSVLDIVKDTNARVIRIEEKLFIGNGEPSVLARLSVLESRADKMYDRETRRNDRSGWVEAARFIGYMIAAAAIALNLAPH